MYINQQKHAGHEESVLAAQILGWMFESHCWVEGEGFENKVCLWCNAVSKEDMKIEGLPGREPLLCHANPLLAPVPEVLAAIKTSVPAPAAIAKYTGRRLVK